MLRSQILVILDCGRDTLAAVSTACKARETAAQPELLRFAIAKEYGESFWALAGDSLPREQVCLYDLPLSSLAQEEGHFLLLGGKYDFAPQWDRALYTVWQRLGQDRALLTGVMEPGQPRLPALTATGDTVRIHPGLSLVSAAAPVRTLVADPAFLFGPASFFAQQASSLSLAAFAGGYTLYVPPEAFLWAVGKLADRPLLFPEKVLPGTTAARFEQLTGLSHDIGRVKAAMGLFGVANTYPQRLPQGTQLQQRIRRIGLFSREAVKMPLLVSAFIDLEARSQPAPFYLLRFGFLKAIQSLPLFLYTGGMQERALRAAFPNTQSYPDKAVRDALPAADDERERFARSKPLLLSRAAKRQAEFTHAAWLDMDILPHPICPEAIPDFRPLMDERIHMAVVDGTLDASFFVAPTSLLRLLEKETAAMTQFDAELKRPLTETTLWERLYEKMPRLFAVHPMPARRLLFLSLFDSRLLSAREASLLESVSPPYYPKGEGFQ